MDYLRRCYFSKWRLDREGGELRDGFYFFAPPKNPVYPGSHLLGSETWRHDPLNPETALGEWAGPRRYHRGDPPALLPRPVKVGSEDCIANGETPGKPKITSRSPWCHRMLPLGCYPDETELALLTNWKRCDWAVHCIKVIVQQYEDIPGAISLAQGYFPETMTVRTLPRTDELPSVIALYDDENVFVFIEGTTGAVQGWMQGLHFGRGPADYGQYSACGIYEEAATDLLRWMSGQGFGIMKRFVFAGHSYGGAIAYVAAAKVKNVDKNRRVECITFGMPKAGDTRLVEYAAGVRQSHYCIDGDPVPFSPPQGADFDFLRLLIIPAYALQFGIYARPTRQLVIRQDGKIEARTEEPIREDVAAMIALLGQAGADAPTFRNHRSGTYAHLLSLGCPCTPEVVPSPPAIVFQFGRMVIEGTQFQVLFDPIASVDGDKQLYGVPWADREFEGAGTVGGWRPYTLEYRRNPEEGQWQARIETFFNIGIASTAKAWFEIDEYDPYEGWSGVPVWTIEPEIAWTWEVINPGTVTLTPFERAEI